MCFLIWWRRNSCTLSFFTFCDWFAFSCPSYLSCVLYSIIHRGFLFSIPVRRKRIVDFWFDVEKRCKKSHKIKVFFVRKWFLMQHTSIFFLHLSTIFLNKKKPHLGLHTLMLDLQETEYISDFYTIRNFHSIWFIEIQDFCFAFVCNQRRYFSFVVIFC